MQRHTLRLGALTALLWCAALAGAQSWISIPPEARPYTRWWWLGSAVDSAGITAQMEAMQRAGIGGVEITPIYGVQGNEARERPFLSSSWMRMLDFTITTGRRLGMEVDMATGTGWPFGGPDVPKAQGAAKVVWADGHIAVGRTGQKVKRAAPGGEGLVIDHFDETAVRSYLAGIETAFVRHHTQRPAAFFNDSYEVYGADWTPRLPEAFARRRGYRLEDHADTLFMDCDSAATPELHRLLLSDYRETLGELLLDNFTRQWTSWAHTSGAVTRNQAHGSPANLIDIYAAVDIPECEGFGLSDFGIRGLRADAEFTKKNFSDISMLKYASSAAHIAGKPLTSSETFTWLTEHFRTSLSQCKPDLDLMFVAGVNHVVFHGTCYSPAAEPWPGWRFYASVDMSPMNPQWSAMPAFSAYIARSQAFLQWGEPDNDFLVYLPYYDMIHDQPGRLALFDIHSMAQRAPRFIATIQRIIRAGWDVDYTSDAFLGSAVTSRYAAVIVPEVRFMPLATLRRLLSLAEDEGQAVVFIGHYPQAVPGLGRRLKGEQAEFDKILRRLRRCTTVLPSDTNDPTKVKDGPSEGAGERSEDPLRRGLERLRLGRPETMRTLHGLSCVRRRNAAGWHYFISNLTPRDVEADVRLGVPFRSAECYDPMTGHVRTADTDAGAQTVHLRLASGESVILRTYTADTPLAPAEPRRSTVSDTPLHGWTLTMAECAPRRIDGQWAMETPRSWTELPDTALLTTMATGRYATSVRVDAVDAACRYVLHLGDVRESARVVVNGHEAATLFAVPFDCDITQWLHEGDNALEVFVTNLPANRIAQMDRDGVAWRHFKEINVVDLNYRRTLYSDWAPVPSGLCSDVTLEVRR